MHRPHLIGRECGLYIDWRRSATDPPGPGDYLATPAGAGYEILTARPTRGRPERIQLRCVRLHAVDIPAEARTVVIQWYPRKRTRP